MGDVQTDIRLHIFVIKQRRSNFTPAKSRVNFRWPTKTGEERKKEKRKRGEKKKKREGLVR
jgi:hypothetical protein